MKDKTILLVEDNPDDVQLTLRALKMNRIVNTVIVVPDGTAALDYLSGPGPLPTVVLLDLKLPKMDGLEVLRRIRASERWKRLPVVVLTSSREEQDILQCYNLGANSYIRKSVDFTQFTEVARQLGLYWLLLNEPPPQ